MPRLTQRYRLSSLPILLSLSKLFSLPFSLARPTSNNLRTTLWAVNAAKEAPIETEDPPDSPIFWWKLGLSVGLVLLGGVFAGLTLALMGSDDLNLRVLSTSSDDPTERKAAAKVLRLLARGRHWVLVVLLLGNVIVNESLPIFLDDVLGGGLYAVIVSTTMIVIFGEIIPQAVCVRYGLQIGGACAPFVLGLMILFFPIAYPIAKLLDYVLGRDEGHTYKKAELKSFLQFHREGEEPLRDDEIGILNGVLSLNEKHVQEIMTPIKDCLFLPADKVLDHQTIDQILLSGFSRIPIHEPGQADNFIGMLLVKRLITYNPEDEWPISKLSLLPLPEARPDINCFQALDYFQTGRAHLLLISETPGRRGGALGIVSLEDLIEEIIGEEIVDETDRFQDNRSRKIAKRAGTGAVMRGIIERHRTTINAIGALSRRSSAAQGVDGREAVQLSAPSGTNDGLLIQFNDGALVAEPVAIPDDSNAAVRVGGKRLVVGNSHTGTPGGQMESMDEGVLGRSPRIAVHHPTGEEQFQENGGAGDDHKGAGEDGDLLGDETPSRRDAPSADESMVFPTHQDFEDAANAFIMLYEGQEYGTGPSRTNRGWEWREHPKRGIQHYGYMYRPTTRHVSLRRQESDEDVPDLDDVEHANEDDDDAEDDPSEHRRLLDPSSSLSPRHGASASSSRWVDKVEVEHHIIYSRTYHVPQLMLRAWDSIGAPLPLSSLISSGILRPGSQVQSSPSIGARDDALLLDPHSPFPLIQQVEHPTTGEVVWGIHPCQVSEAVDEVLRAESPRSSGVRDSGRMRAVQRRVRWLETWIMISSGVVDLAHGHA